jgi:hypothetical protein
VNEAFVKTFLTGVDPLTVSLTVWMQPENPYVPIVGVVGDVSEGSIRESSKPTVFYSHTQLPETTMTLFVRTRQPGAVAAAAVGEVRRIDPNLAVTKLRTYERALAEASRASG